MPGALLLACRYGFGAAYGTGRDDRLRRYPPDCSACVIGRSCALWRFAPRSGLAGRRVASLRLPPLAVDLLERKEPAITG